MAELQIGAFGEKVRVVENLSDLPARSARNLVLASGLLGVAVCGVHVAALYGQPRVANATGYACYAVTLWACAAACLFAARKDHALRLRWHLFALANFAMSLRFLLASLAWSPRTLNWLTAQRSGVWCFAFGHALLLVAATIFFSGASKRMAALDSLQALLFGVLHFALIFAPKTFDRFTRDHLLVSTGIQLFLFLVALTSLPGAGSRAESRFLRLLSLFLGMQFAGAVCMNQIGYVLLHHKLASIWDVPETLFNVAFAAIAVYAVLRPESTLSEPHPTLFIRNLMPSFLALGNLALGLVILPLYPGQGVAAILFAILCFMLRTVLLLGQAGQERESLYAQNLQLEELAWRDTLTGVGNRRSLEAALTCLTAARSSDPFTLLLVDTDHFKQANDLCGHVYGDSVLVAIASVLRSATEKIPASHCARFGGDEFALLLPRVDAADAYRFAEDVRLKVEGLSLKAGEKPISISLGATISRLSPPPAFEALVSHADQALYLAKSKGRNRVEIAL